MQDQRAFEWRYYGRVIWTHKPQFYIAECSVSVFVRAAIKYLWQIAKTISMYGCKSAGNFTCGQVLGMVSHYAIPIYNDAHVNF